MAPEDTVAVSFGDTNIMLDEVTYMIRSMEYTYESYFGHQTSAATIWAMVQA